MSECVCVSFLCVCEGGNLSLGGHDSYSSIVEVGVQTRGF